jgi:hypothetical protein
MLCAKIYQLHVLARFCRGHAHDRFQEEPVGCCLGKLCKDKILLVGSRELLWGCLMSAIKPEVVTGRLCYEAGLLGPTAELRHILDGDV